MTAHTIGMPLAWHGHRKASWPHAKARLWRSLGLCRSIHHGTGMIGSCIYDIYCFHGIDMSLPWHCRRPRWHHHGPPWHCHRMSWHAWHCHQPSWHAWHCHDSPCHAMPLPRIFTVRHASTSSYDITLDQPGIALVCHETSMATHVTAMDCRGNAVLMSHLFRGSPWHCHGPFCITM